MADGIGAFTDEAARERFLAAYEQAMAYWPDPREERDVATHFGRTRVYRYGAGESTPVVLLPGQNATPAEWAPHVRELAEGGRPVFAVDRVGEPGLSEQHRAFTGPDDLAAWLEEALEALELTRVHMIGHSYGGYVALEHAARTPSRLASLTVYEPPRALAPLKPGFLLGAVGALIGPDSFRRRWFTNLVGEIGVSPEESEAGTRLAMAALSGFRIRLPQPQRVSDDALRSLTVPTFVLLGDSDRALNSRRAEARCRRLIPTVRTEILPGAGHGMPVGPFNSRVPAFLRAVERGEYG